MQKATMLDLKCGEDGGQILASFRKVARSHVELFRAQRNHVHDLLGGRHNYSSGAFREGLLKDFLSSILPKAVSVDSGFIYGFDQVPNSRQIDIIVWHSAGHSPVFRGGDFVIVSPESVIAALSVKTTLSRPTLRESFENLQSLVDLELAFRSHRNRETGELLHRSILKVIVAYECAIDLGSILHSAREYYEDMFAGNPEYARQASEILSNFDPFKPSQKDIEGIGRFLPAMVTAFESNELSLVRGWGPPEHNVTPRTYGSGLRRLPYMYAQDAKLTTPLEKLVYRVMEATYLALGTTGWSLVSAWGELNPALGFRFGDAEEILEGTSAPLLNPDRLPDRKTLRSAAEPSEG